MFDSSYGSSYGTATTAAGNSNGVPNIGEQTPVRRRENDNIVCSPPAASAQVQQQQQTHQPHPGQRRRRSTALPTQQRQFNTNTRTSAELPFSSFNRRYRHDHARSCSDRWVHYAFRAVLLSPVLILAIWSMAAIFFSHNHMQQQQSAYKASATVAGTMRQAVSVPVQSKQKKHAPATEQIHRDTRRKHGSTTTNKTGPSHPAPVTTTALASTRHQQGLVVQPQGSPPLTVVQSQGTSGMLMQAQPVTENQQPVVMATNKEHQGSLGSSSSSGGQQVLQPILIDPPLAGANTVQSNEQQQLQLPLQQQGTTTAAVYYYDTGAARKTLDGQFLLPETVYDAAGHPISLQVVANSAKEVYLQSPLPPPPLGSVDTTAEQNATPLKAVQPVQQENKVTAGFNQGEGASSPVDSGILVATVGILALLGGALSARKLRSRSWISACIENEALAHEDAAAYDDASTVAGAGPYNTFHPTEGSRAPGSSWRRDLEKFDV